MDDSIRSKAWIQTFSGLKFHILEPCEEEVDIIDIAHGLAMQCRFTGQTLWHYSVAQHSYYCSKLVPEKFAFEALMHDASEAYIGDMSRPLKHYSAAGYEYLQIEAKIEDVIKRKFGLPAQMSPEVKDADNAMLYAEKAELMSPMEWDTRWAETVKPIPFLIEQWHPNLAERMFLERFHILCKDTVWVE